MITKDILASSRSFRSKARSSVPIVFCIAIGIAAASAVTTLVYTVLYRPLPFENPEQLVRLWMAEPEGGDDQVELTYPEFRDIRSASATLDQVAALGRSRLGLIAGDTVARVRGEAVSEDYFDLLGVSAEKGRLFAPDEYGLGSQPTMILTHRLWSTHFARDPDIVGSTVRTADQTFTIIGVMPSAFRGTVDGDEIEFWIPVQHHLGAERLEDRESRNLYVIARRQTERDPQAVASEMAALGQGFVEAYPEGNRDLSLRIEPVGAEWRDDFRSNGLLLAAAVSMLLLVAALNVAGLMLTRTLSRRRQLAIQSAIGATRFRIFRALMIETSMLVAIGGALGIAIAPWILRTLLATAPIDLPDYLSIQADLRASLLAFGVVAVTALVSGFLPALMGARTPMTEVLNQGGGKSTASGLEKHFSIGLVVAEVALTMILLVCSSMLLRSHQARNNVELGFRNDVARFAVSLTEQDVATEENLTAFYDRARRELGSYPGVESVGFAWPVLPPRDWSKWSIRWNGMPANLEDRGLRVGGHAVDAGFFETLDIPLITGRLFESNDLPDGAPVCLVSRTLAETLGGVQQALGQEIQAGSRAYRVVGVVEDVLYGGAPDADRRPFDLYLSHGQQLRRLLSVAVRTSGDPTAMAELRARIQKLAPSSPVHWVSTMDEELSTIYANSRFYVMLVGAFAFNALLLTAVGLFALLSNFVTRRTREFGICMAIGATHISVIREVVLRGLTMVGVGLIIGLGGTLLVRDLMVGFLYQVAAIDWVSFFIGSIVLTLVGLLACYLPARRASCIDPIVALRHE